MSNFTGRRAPNVSQYLANLNLPAGAPELSAPDEFGFDGGLDFLTNTEFFDFDGLAEGNVSDFAQSNANAASQKQPQPPANISQQGSQAVGINNPQYQFNEFQTFASLGTTSNSTITPNPEQSLHGHYPAPPLLYPQQQQHQPNVGDKRKSSGAGIPTAADLEEASRMAAEEDKRRRNTAASARFRIKKKQREQALEKQAKEMAEKVQQLEGKVQQLEMENKWLKGLITAKSAGTELKIPNNVERKEEKEVEDLSTESRTDGVGTADETGVTSDASLSV
jgi:DNA-binding protein YbaB